MKTKLLAAAAALALAAAAQSSHAATVWTTLLEYDNTGLISSLGTVTATDMDSGKDVQVTVTLDAGAFVDTGSHYVFTFNLDNDAGNVVTVNDPLPDGPGGNVDFIYANTWSQTTTSTHCTGPKAHPTCTTTTTTQTDPPPYTNSPFGTYTNAFFLNPDGGSNTVPSPFTFTVHNEAGITFAGLGAQTDGSGKLITLGTGLNFYSNSTGSVPGAGPGGWWFAVDTSGTDGHCSPTCTIAGRDAYTSLAVPEPASWALMITGFGAAGAMIRRRRTAVA